MVYALRNTTDFVNFVVEEACADVNTRDDDGRTSLHHAAVRDSTEAPMALLWYAVATDRVLETSRVWGVYGCGCEHQPPGSPRYVLTGKDRHNRKSSYRCSSR